MRKRSKLITGNKKENRRQFYSFQIPAPEKGE